MDTPTYDKVNKALCQSKIVFLIIFDSTQKRDEAISICKEAALRMSEYETEILTIDLHDKIEKPLLQSLHIEENSPIPLTIVITPQAIAGQYKGIIEADNLVAETRSIMKKSCKCGCNC